MRKIIFLLILLNFTSLESQDYSARVIPEITPGNVTINMGPCYIGDTVETWFELNNTGTSEVFVGNGAPSFIIKVSPNDPGLDWFQGFNEFPVNITFNIPAQAKDTLYMRFNENLVSGTPLGWHEANLIVGFTSDAQFQNLIAKPDSFLLRVKKTDLRIDGYEDLLEFDSIYIEPNLPHKRKWRIKNTWIKRLTAFDKDISYITSKTTGDEFFFDGFEKIELNAKDSVHWNFEYRPLNIGRDTAQFRLWFRPVPGDDDSVRFAKVNLTGTGVKQNLTIISSAEHDFRNDTIFLGNVRTDDVIDIEATLRNDGNLPFGTLSEEVTDRSGQPNQQFELTAKFSKNSNHLPPNESESFKIRFIPQVKGSFTYEYRIESDIFTREIGGVQPAKRYEVIYITGNSVSPEISVPFDTIDFGNVVVNSAECSSTRDTIIQVFNLGNDDLIVNNIEIKPDNLKPRFLLDDNFLNIAPGKIDTIQLEFTPDNNFFGDYLAQLVISTNQEPPGNEVILFLKAKSIPPIGARLGFPEITFKPNTPLSVPVILENGQEKPAGYAGNFKAEVNFDPEFFRFTDVSTTGTASEGAIDRSSSAGASAILIDLEMPGNSFFAKSDTICFIEFGETYFGFSKFTELSWGEARLGDKNCPEVLEIESVTGIVEMDSICGLEDKLVRPQGVFYFDVKSSNSGSISIEFYMPYETRADFRLYDSYGRLAGRYENSVFPSGENQIELETGNLPDGIYHAVMKSSTFMESKKVVLAR